MWVVALIVGGLVLSCLMVAVTMGIAHDDAVTGPAQADAAAGKAMLFARPSTGNVTKTGLWGSEWGELRLADGVLSFAEKEGAEPVWQHPARDFTARVGLPSVVDRGIFLHLEHAELGALSFQVSNSRTEMNRASGVFFQDGRERDAAYRFIGVLAQPGRE